MPPARHPSRRPAATLPVEPAVTFLMMLVVACLLAVSSTLLTARGIHYLTSGGAFYEKLHPATYFAALAFAAMLLRHANPAAGLATLLAQSRAFLVFLLCWMLLSIHVAMLGRPFTVIVDTYLLPALLCALVWQLSAGQKAVLVKCLHGFLLLNIALGYYEYFSGRHLMPLTVGDLPVLNEWRSSALLGHPLTASGLVGAYVLALVLRPSLVRLPALRLALVTFSLGSLMVFGGRTALVAVLLIMAGAAGVRLLRLVRGERVALPAVIAALFIAFVLAAGAFAAFDLGLFDKMLLRFSSDKGSALARVATFHFLSNFSLGELAFGPDQVRANALQRQMGLSYGIENFWISCIVQFGVVHTVILTIGLTALFFDILRRSHPAAWAVMLMIVLIAASSVSFSSKNIQLAQFVLLMVLLLPHEVSPGPTPGRPGRSSAQPRERR
jgi:hypothetical protein